MDGAPILLLGFSNTKEQLRHQEDQPKQKRRRRLSKSSLRYLGVLAVATLSTSASCCAAAAGTLAFAPSAGGPLLKRSAFSWTSSSPHSSCGHATRRVPVARGCRSRCIRDASSTTNLVMSWARGPRAGNSGTGPLLTAVRSVLRRRRGKEALGDNAPDARVSTKAFTAARGGVSGSSIRERLSWRRGEWSSSNSNSNDGSPINGERGGAGDVSKSYAPWSEISAGERDDAGDVSRSYAPWSEINAGERGGAGDDSRSYAPWSEINVPLSATRESTPSAGAPTGLERARDSSGGKGEVEGAEEAWAVSDGPVEGDEGRTRGGIKIGADLMEDVRRRSKLYASDWRDGLNGKSVPAILFLYFACLLPAVAFGGIASQVTQGTLGVIEYLVACGLGGMTYAALSGQPMTFIGPTGLTLAFMTSLYSFTSLAGLPFLPVYAWVGMWTSCFLVMLSLIGASNLIRYATQFTDDVFNALLSVNFIYEAARSLMRNFSPAAAGYSQAGALMSLNVAVATYVGCRQTSAAVGSRVFNSRFREVVSDFGPLMVIAVMSCFCALPSCKGLLSFLEVPSTLTLGHGRSWLVPIFSVGPAVRIFSALPAVLLTSLFFLDQNISSRVVNSPRHKMTKGPAYHQDMLVLGVITGLLSIVGLPWQCAATVQSLNHVRQLATFKAALPEDGGRSEEIESVFETRLTGFCVHALVLTSLALLPQLSKIPMAVVSGIFLYLGRKVMSGNAFLIRMKEVIVDRDMLTADSDIRKVGFRTALKYTAVQAAMLSLLWTLKSFGRTALFFPSVIGLLIIVRLFALPKLFSDQDLSKIDAAVG